jgi:hypothetical protein
MGVTIHYSGRAKDRASVDRIMQIITNSAYQWDWPTAHVEDPDGEIVRMLQEPGEQAELDHSGISFIDADDPEASSVEIYEGPVNVLVVQPGEGCEPFRLAFDREHRMDGFTKTQYGPAEAHVRICALLRSIERHFEVLEVHDESGFYESDDRDALNERIGQLADTPEAVIARYEAAKRKKAMEDMYKVDGDDD